MTTRKGKRTTKATAKQEEDNNDTSDTSDTDALAEAVDRALESARLADDAAQDIEAMKEQQNTFIEKIQSNGKRLSALAIGALAGAAVSMALSGLVYFRSVKDMRENAELQAETMAQLLAQTAALQEVVTQAGNQQGTIVNDLSRSLEDATERLSTEMADYATELASLQPQMATGLGDDVSGKIDAMQTDIMGAIADLELSIASMSAASGTGGIDISPLIQQLEAAILDLQTARPAPAAAPAPTPRSGTGSSGTSRSTPRATPRAPEPNPFSYP